MQTFGYFIEEHLRSLTSLLGEISVLETAAVMPGLTHDEVVAVIENATRIIQQAEGLRTIAAGVAAAQSSRGAGHDGLAQSRGHRSAVSLIQDLTGVSRAQAGKVARLGRELLETPTADIGTSSTGSPSGGEGDAETGEASSPNGGAATAGGSGGNGRAPARPWHARLSDAYATGRLSLDEQSAIRRGLGEPPIVRTESESESESDSDSDSESDAGPGAAADAETLDAWALAAEQLIEEASRLTPEELGAAARAIRDHLDPEGAQRRFDEQHQARSFQVWKDADGITCAKIRCEPGGGAWLTAIVDAALRPRRGGPRFVDPDEKADAERLINDPRTNGQLAYDLFIDIVHSGALADAATVFGTRQAGVRVIVTETARAAAEVGRAAVATIEDTNTTVPAAFAGQQACDTGTVGCVVDGTGDPLNLGRHARLFSAKQRLALAVRDAGCIWPRCDRPPSYCESHHIDRYSDGGRTDVDRGVLLCRFHHMNLHHHGWRITRDGTGPFVLHSPHPDAAPLVLARRLQRRYAWGDLQPPSTRFRPAA